MVFCPYEFPDVNGCVCLEPMSSLGGTDERLTAFEIKEAVMWTLFGDGISECPDRREHLPMVGHFPSQRVGG